MINSVSNKIFGKAKLKIKSNCSQMKGILAQVMTSVFHSLKEILGKVEKLGC